MNEPPRSRPLEGKRQKGFTLIEIMVVVMIIGLLVVYVGPRVFGRQETAELVKIKRDISALNEAVKLYRLDHRRYPDTLEALIERDEEGRKVMDELPKDPWGYEYILEQDEDGEPLIICLGWDNEQDTEDDITNKNMRDLKKLPK